VRDVDGAGVVVSARAPSLDTSPASAETAALVERVVAA
jgi:hypothetical protein